MRYSARRIRRLAGWRAVGCAVLAGACAWPPATAASMPRRVAAQGAPSGAGYPLPAGEPIQQPTPLAAAPEPLHVGLSPSTVMLSDGGRAVTVQLQGATAPIRSMSLDLRFEADRFAVTAIEPDPMLTATGAQLQFKHRLDPGRLRLRLDFTSADPSLLPTGSPAVARVTLAALAAGSGAFTLAPETSSVGGADGQTWTVVLDAPAMLMANDAPAPPLATQVAAQASALEAQSAPASAVGGDGGAGPSAMGRRVLDGLRGAVGGFGGGDRGPMTAWLGVIAAALVLTGLGYALGRAPRPEGPRAARGLRRRTAELRHEVAEEGRER